MRGWSYGVADMESTLVVRLEGGSVHVDHGCLSWMID